MKLKKKKNFYFSHFWSRSFEIISQVTEITFPVHFPAKKITHWRETRLKFYPLQAKLDKIVALSVNLLAKDGPVFKGQLRTQATVF
jgi:hypothetical protein